MSRTARERACEGEREVSFAGGGSRAALKQHGNATHLIKRSESSTPSPDTTALPQRLLEGLSERQRRVLRRVVVIDPQISLASHLKRHHSVLGQRVEHL